MARAVLFMLGVLSLLVLGAGLLLFGQMREAFYCAAGIFLLLVRPPELQLLLAQLLGRAPIPLGAAAPPAAAEARPAPAPPTTEPPAAGRT